MTNIIRYSFLSTALFAAIANAGDSTVDAAIGGGIGGAAGAAIGNEVSGRDGAIIGGALGVAVTTNSEPHHWPAPSQPKYQHHYHRAPSG